MAFGQMSYRMDGNGDTMEVTVGPGRLYMAQGRAITGAPYSGEQVSEHVQTLVDGTHITQQQNREKMYRDSQGRTRTERSLMGGMQDNKSGQFVMVEIRDPVSSSYYVIDDQNRVAHRFAMEAPPARQRAPMTPAQTEAMAKARAENSTEKLGPENIEGVAAEGNKTTRTIPIGEAGNDRPIVTTSETWFSSELKVMVLSKFSDPRNGDQTTRLTNISQAEPDASLFMPPSGYTVVDEKESVKITLKRQ